MIGEFERLCGGFTFVYSWDDPDITPETFRIYVRNVPAKESSHNFIYSVKRLHSKINRNQRELIYLQLQMHSNQEWLPASRKTSTFLDQKLKEQETDCFSNVPYFNVHTMNMVYSAILNLLLAMMIQNKWIFTAFEGSKCWFTPPL